jgi:pilus assembly protein Flp/PilA
MTFINKLFRDESGATAIEYGLIAALIAVAAIVGMGALGDSLDTTFNNVSAELNANNKTPSTGA